MRILHVPFTYFPTQAGGTEVYVAGLCRVLARLGLQNLIAAPSESDSTYLHEDIEVHRFAVQPSLTLEAQHTASGDLVAAAAFANVLDRTRPDIVHFHAFSPAVSVQCLEAVRARGIHAVFTHHTPSATCHRGTLMRWSTTPCDGELKAFRCAACHLHSLGLPKATACAAAALSPLTQFLAPLLPRQAKWQLPTHALPWIQSRHSRIREWLCGMDAVIALNAWSTVMLGKIGVPISRLHTIRHGIEPAEPVTTRGQRTADAPIRLVFLGRLDPNKGLDIVLEALSAVPELPVILHVYTLVENQSGPYHQRIQQLVAADPRIHLLPPVPHVEVARMLSQHDVLVVPSLWLETGPLVVLEAFASGLPVIGSNRGGIPEWVEHDYNGLLIEPTVTLWTNALRRLVAEPDLLPRLRRGIARPRSMQDVASDMVRVYERVLAADSQTAPTV